MSSSINVYKEHPWIQLHSGKKFRLDNPVFDLADIAHALSQLARYNGHGEFPYTVAQHSILVSEIQEQLNLGDPKEGLLHDAVEAYMSDVPAPFKQYLPDWHSIEDELDAKLRKEFHLPTTKTKECKEADWIALKIESDVLFKNQGGNADWFFPLGIEHQAYEFVKKQDSFFQIREVRWRSAKDHFIWRYRRLCGRELTS